MIFSAWRVNDKLYTRVLRDCLPVVRKALQLEGETELKVLRYRPAVIGDTARIGIKWGGNGDKCLKICTSLGPQILFADGADIPVLERVRTTFSVSIRSADLDTHR